MKGKKVLTVYYSHLGHTSVIAKQIHTEAGGDDLISIELQKPYNKSYLGTLIPAGLDIFTGNKPVISNKIDISGYDIIFVGGPVWWMTVPPPVISFLSANDFSGKVLIPFYTSGGNRGRFFKTFHKNSNGAKVLEGIGFTGKDLKTPGEILNKIKLWLSKIEQNI